MNMSDKTNIPCEVAEDLLPSYAEGLTGGKTNELLEAHLRGCAACREKLEAMRSPVAEALSEASPDGAEIDFLKKNRKRNRRILIGSALAALLIALGVLFVKFFIVGSPSPDDGIMANVSVEGSRLRLICSARDKSRGIAGAEVKEESGVVAVTTRTAIRSPFCSAAYELDHTAAEPIRSVIINGKQVYNRAEGKMEFSDEMKQKAIDTWAEYDSLTDVQKMFLETIPGFCYEEFTTWEDAVRFIGFEPVNPFEYEPDFVKMNMGATDIKNPFDKELKHAALDWHGERDGGVTFAILNAGYRLGTVRLIYTAELAENHEADGSGPFYGDPDRETEMIEISNGVFVSAELETGESYGAAEIRFTAGGTPVSVRIINNSGEAGRAAFENAVERVTEIAKRTVE